MAHRSRLGWADEMTAEPAVPPEHTHRLPRVVRLALIGLTAAVFLSLAADGLLATYVFQQQQYIAGKGQQRDRENARTNERINSAICDLLDQLPEGGLLERPRAKYGCGPGIPLSQLTPQEQAQLSGRATATTVTPAAPRSTAIPKPGSAAVPNPPRTAPGTLPPRTGPGPRSAPTPTAPALLDPVTKPVCDLAGVCIEGARP